MRKQGLYIIGFLLLTTGITHAQYYRGDRGFLLGVNAGYTYPLGDMGKILKNGIGGNLSAKYLINDVIGIGFEAGYQSFKTKIMLDNDNTSQDYKCRLMPILFETTFYIPTWNRTILPYFGLHFGAYIINVNVSQKSAGYTAEDLSKKLYMFSPGAGPDIGVIFELSDKAFLDFKIKADYVFKIEDKYELGEYNEPGNIGFSKMLNLGANIGLLYKF